MKVKQLKALLADLPDNADIMLWNGYVQTVVPIGAVDSTCLFKEKFESFRKHCLIEEGYRSDRDIPEQVEEDIKKHYQKMQYEYVPQEWVTGANNKTKKVFVISAKVMRESTFDRIGSISY
jgi:hypothetical protein